MFQGPATSTRQDSTVQCLYDRWLSCLTKTPAVGAAEFNSRHPVRYMIFLFRILDGPMAAIGVHSTKVQYFLSQAESWKKFSARPRNRVRHRVQRLGSGFWVLGNWKLGVVGVLSTLLAIGSSSPKLL